MEAESGTRGMRTLPDEQILLMNWPSYSSRTKSSMLHEHAATLGQLLHGPPASMNSASGNHTLSDCDSLKHEIARLFSLRGLHVEVSSIQLVRRVSGHLFAWASPSWTIVWSSFRN